MELNRTLIQNWFRQFNNDIFANKLPEIPLFISYSKTRMGVYVERLNKINNKIIHKQRSIRISNYYKCSEKEYQDTLIHEMIHYYIAYKGLKDTAPHGVIFHKIMNEINAKHNRNINVSVKKNAKLEESFTNTKLRLILALQTKDGKFMFSSVNPAYARTIDKQLKCSNIVIKHAWFISKDVFFNNYPTVRSARGIIVTKEIYNKMINEMKPFNGLNE